MNNPEEAIERVLTGLRDAEVPTGMEARILRAMESRTVRQDAREPWRGWFVARIMLGRGNGLRLAGGVAFAGVVVLAALVSHLRTKGPATRGNGTSVASGVPAVEKDTIPQRLEPLDSGGGYGMAEGAPPSKTGSWAEAVGDSATGGPVDGEPNIRGAAISRDASVDYDSLAMSEMLAPSRPAPPLPMTHQEKLLADAVHQGGPGELDQLRPEVRDKQVEISKAEFHDFFDPPSVDPPHGKDNE